MHFHHRGLLHLSPHQCDIMILQPDNTSRSYSSVKDSQVVSRHSARRVLCADALWANKTGSTFLNSESWIEQTTTTKNKTKKAKGFGSELIAIKTRNVQKCFSTEDKETLSVRLSSSNLPEQILPVNSETSSVDKGSCYIICLSPAEYCFILDTTCFSAAVHFHAETAEVTIKTLMIRNWCNILNLKSNPASLSKINIIRIFLCYIRCK